MAYTIQSHGQVDPWSAHSQHVCLSHSIPQFFSDLLADALKHTQTLICVAVLQLPFCIVFVSDWMLLVDCLVDCRTSILFNNSRPGKKSKQLDRPSNDSRCWNLFLRSDTTEVQRLPALIPV